jgi:hypothetical protein
MEAVILIGIQGSGESTFCRERFFNTHVRISISFGHFCSFSLFLSPSPFLFLLDR